MKRIPLRNRKVLQRLMEDIRVLTDRESAALERRDFEELESVQETKGILTEALARHWKRSGVAAGTHPVLATRLKELLEAGRRNHEAGAEIIGEMVDSAYANAAASQRLHAVRGRYASELNSPCRLKAKG